MDRSFFGLFQHLQASPSSLDDDAVLVLIDENSIKEMGKRGVRWPWPRDNFAALFVALHQAEAKKILADLIFLEPSEDDIKDQVLASYAAATPVVLGEIHDKKQIIWPPAYQMKFPALKLTDRIALVRHEPDSDGIMRSYNYDNSLASKGFEQSVSGTRLLRWPCDLKSLIENHPKKVLAAYPWISFGKTVMAAAGEKIGDNDLDPEQLKKILSDLPKPSPEEMLNVKGKTVFIGVNAAAAYDVKSTPLSQTEPGVMYHLAAWSNAKKQNWLNPSPFPILPLSLLLCGLVLFLGMNEKIRVGAVALLGTSFVFITIGSSWLLFQNGIWMPPVDLTLSIALGFGAVAVHNWRTENQHKQQVKALFGSYVSEKVLDKLLDNPEAIKLGGERKQLTVYFSDLAGFTDMSEGMSPEDLLGVVNTYLDEMSPFIIENGGYLDKYIGDAIMGVFGSPEVLPDHAAAACKAALESRDHLLKLSARMEAERGVPLHARIGINSGDIIVGNVGSQKKLNYTVVGDAVNLASRLEGANKEFGTTIMLGENTAALLDDRFALRPIELLRVKGKKKPVQTYELFEWTHKLTPSQKDLLENFRQGYASYRDRDFAAACDKFNIACKIDNRDNLSRVYANRCAQYLAEPPPPDWDGVFVMTKK